MDKKLKQFEELKKIINNIYDNLKPTSNLLDFLIDSSIKTCDYDEMQGEIIVEYMEIQAMVIVFRNSIEIELLKECVDYD